MTGMKTKIPDGGTDAKEVGKRASLLGSIGGGWGKRNSAGVAIASSLSFEDVCISVDGHTILEDVNLTVEPGKVLCLLGPSGSGKTSLLRVAAGLLKPDRGTVKIDNRVVSSDRVFVPPETRGVGMVFQDYALFPHLTIRANVEFGLTAFGTQGERHDHAMRILKRVGLADRAEEYPDVLSGGEQQRVALARALAPRPGILLMDEPFSGLDARLRDTVREETIDLLRETRSTAVIVTHDAEEALRVGDHIALIGSGKLVQEGSGDDLYYRPCNLFAAGFFSELNVIPGEATRAGIQTVFGLAGKISGEGGAETCQVAIRHSDVDVKAYENLGEGRVGRIVSRRFTGGSDLLEMVVEGLDGVFFARTQPHTLAEDTELVLINVKPESMMIFSGDSQELKASHW